jgi:hypothetical protein
MSRRAKLEPLLAVSGLILDARLSTLDRAARACNDSRARLADLARPSDSAELPLTVAAQAALRYERWAEARRAEINLTLARQTAEWLTARDEARLAFGRAEALRAIVRRERNR